MRQPHHTQGNPCFLIASTCCGKRQASAVWFSFTSVANNTNLIKPRNLLPAGQWRRCLLKPRKIHFRVPWIGFEVLFLHSNPSLLKKIIIIFSVRITILSCWILAAILPYVFCTSQNTAQWQDLCVLLRSWTRIKIPLIILQWCKLAGSETTHKYYQNVSA